MRIPLCELHVQYRRQLIVLISRSVYFSGNYISRSILSNETQRSLHLSDPTLLAKKPHVLVALMLPGAFRLIADNPLPTELLPAVSFVCVVVSSIVLKVGGRFHDKRKILLCGS